MPSNKNFNNNHNSASAASAENSSNKDEFPENEMNEKVWEETRQVVKLFLERSLSQNAKSSMGYMKPEGYHKLKQEGKLLFYQRQQSKPERGKLTRTPADASPSNKIKEFKLTPTLPSHLSLNETTIVTSANSDLRKEHAKFYSDNDLSNPRRCSDPVDISDNTMIYKLIDSNSEDLCFHSSDSLPSTGDEGTKHLRSSSFTKAISRRSVISYLESKEKQDELYGADNEIYKERNRKGHGSVRTSEIIVHRTKSAVAEAITAVHSQSETKDDTANQHTLEKKSSMREKWKKIMPGALSRKKSKQRKRCDQQRVSEEEHREVSTESFWSTSKAASFPQKSGQSEHDRSASPVKMQVSPPQSRNISPQIPVRHIHHSSSSSSLTYTTTNQIAGQLERNKSGSLPLSLRIGVSPDYSFNAPKSRRYSEDCAAPYKVCSKNSLSKHHTASDHSPARPHHLDLSHKKGKSGRFRRLFRFWKKRHSSESSSTSSLSQSLPSLQAPIGQESEFNEKDYFQNTLGIHFRKVDDDELRGRDYMDGNVLQSSDTKHKPYHHRGSLSFSSGDLDGISIHEKQKIYDEIAETLSRISVKFNRHIQSRSSTPGSRLTTPESSFSTQEYRQYAKGSRSGPPGRQTVHQSGKSFRKYRDESQPALTAYMNIANQRDLRSNNTHKMASKMPRSFPFRRHTHHAPTGSLDSPYRNAQTTSEDQSEVSPEAVRKGDVVDGLPSGDADKESLGIAHLRIQSSSVGDARAETNTLPLLISPNGLQSDVDFPQNIRAKNTSNDGLLMEGTPCTSFANRSSFEDDTSPSSEIDEDKLVDLLVQAICQRGDEYTRSIDMPNGVPLEPAFRMNVVRYMSRASYDRFEHFATRFCNNVRQLVETSPPRHPDIFPVVMVFNMTRIMVDLVSSESTRQAVDHILQYSTQFVTRLVQNTGNTWGTVLEQLQDTEAELSDADSPTETPRRLGNTYEEVD
ncbi:uncharacterized protein LOC143466871 isoform X2 [Clavelina lepadiformis]|uniref:uncharacterized protein LOC143466871 isoform X2 n=1 Tax=Clavelina lepadiformis TaxID=159417 RepID=UPI004040FF4F